MMSRINMETATMKKLFLTVAATAITMALVVDPVRAGGPVLITPEETEVADETVNRGNGLIWVVGGAIVLCAILCGGSDDAPPEVVPGPICNKDC